MANQRDEFLQAAAKYGPSVNGVAKQYGLSGAQLLAKLAKGESGFDMGAVSSAGARGGTQFMPATRDEYKAKYGVDAYASPDSAVHAAALYLRNGKSLASYNPGDPSYTSYILGQKVGKLPRGGGPAGAGGGSRRVTLGATGSATATGSVPVDTSPNTDAITQLTQALQRPEPQPAFSHLSLPDFAAAPPLPQGYQPTAPTAPAPAPDYSQLLQQLSQGSQQSQVNVPVSASAQRSVSAGIDVATGLAGSGASEGTAKLGGALVTAATKRANLIDAQHLPYSWGGGHAKKVTSYRNTVPLDCSGAVSAVLGIDPRVSGDFEKFGKPGVAPQGKGITIYANKTHVLMSINGRFFGTSRSNPGGGAGWIPSSAISKGYLKNFTARHVG